MWKRVRKTGRREEKKEGTKEGRKEEGLTKERRITKNAGEAGNTSAWYGNIFTIHIQMKERSQTRDNIQINCTP